MSAPSWFERLRIALEFDAGFEIFLFVGREEHARPGLAQIATRLGRGSTRWHRLHLDGLESLLQPDDSGPALHLVHGFERMAQAHARELAARLNLNRDRLEILGAPVLFWIPERFYEDLQREAPDLIAWRTQVSVVSDDELEVEPELLAEELLLCEAFRSAAGALTTLPEVDVMDEGERRPILEWLDEGPTRALAYASEDAPLRVVTWCAGQRARARELGESAHIPVLFPNLLERLASELLAEGSSRLPALSLGLERLLSQGRLAFCFTTPLALTEWERVDEQLGANELIAALGAEAPVARGIAPLSDAQVSRVVDACFGELEAYELERWRDAMLETLERFGDKLRHLGVLFGVIEYWRHLGLSSVQDGLPHRGWREHSLWVACSYSQPPSRELGFEEWEPELVRLFCSSPHELASLLHRFSQRAGGLGLSGAQLRWSQSSVELHRLEGRIPPRRAFVEALIALAESIGAEEEGVAIWREAVELARALDPPDHGVLSQALGGLGFSLNLVGMVDEAQSSLEDALALARGSEGPARIAQLLAHLMHNASDRGRFERALTLAREAYGLIEHLPLVETRSQRIDLLDGFQVCYQKLGDDESALEVARERMSLRREVSSMWPLELLGWAHELLRASEFDEALTAANEAMEIYRERAPHVGYAQSLHLIAQIQAAAGNTTDADGFLRECVVAYLDAIVDGAPGWANGELAECLGNLSKSTPDDPKLHALQLRAARVLETQIGPRPSYYPTPLAKLLTRIGELAAPRGELALAAGAYERVLELAAPFQVRTNEAILELRGRVDALYASSGVTPDAARRAYADSVVPASHAPLGLFPPGEVDEALSERVGSPTASAPVAPTQNPPDNP